MLEILKHLVLRKAKNAALGDGLQDVDVDEFINKCISFMCKGDEALLILVEFTALTWSLKLEEVP